MMWMEGSGKGQRQRRRASVECDPSCRMAAAFLGARYEHETLIVFFSPVNRGVYPKPSGDFQDTILGSETQISYQLPVNRLFQLQLKTHSKKRKLRIGVCVDLPNLPFHTSRQAGGPFFHRGRCKKGKSHKRKFLARARKLLHSALILASRIPSVDQFH
jgi:hypothetical protein